MVDAIPDRFERSGLFSDTEKAVVAASIELTKGGSLADETFDRLAHQLDERQLVELVVNASIANLNNRMTDVFAADIEEG